MYRKILIAGYLVVIIFITGLYFVNKNKTDKSIKNQSNNPKNSVIIKNRPTLTPTLTPVVTIKKNASATPTQKPIISKPVIKIRRGENNEKE